MIGDIIVEFEVRDTDTWEFRTESIILKRAEFIENCICYPDVSLREYAQTVIQLNIPDNWVLLRIIKFDEDDFEGVA